MIRASRRRTQSEHNAGMYNHPVSGHTGHEVIFMTPKEVLYVEDALGHAQFLKTQCQDAVDALRDPELKRQAQQWLQENQAIFRSFYSLV